MQVNVVTCTGDRNSYDNDTHTVFHNKVSLKSLYK